MAMKKHEKVLNDLRKRNDVEKRFEGVVKLCVSLHESVDFLEKENGRLRAQKARLEEENLPYSENSPNNTKANNTLLRKIYDLQTELAELHKNKGDHAEEVIDLRRALDEKERYLKIRTEQLESTRAALAVAEEKRTHFEEKAFEAANNLQLLQDEYAALLLTYTSMKGSKEKLEKEYEDLASRWLIYQGKEADADDELVRRVQDAKVQEELEDAIKEPFGVDSFRSIRLNR